MTRAPETPRKGSSELVIDDGQRNTGGRSDGGIKRRSWPLSTSFGPAFKRVQESSHEVFGWLHHNPRNLCGRAEETLHAMAMGHIPRIDIQTILEGQWLKTKDPLSFSTIFNISSAYSRHPYEPMPPVPRVGTTHCIVVIGAIIKDTLHKRELYKDRCENST